MTLVDVVKPAPAQPMTFEEASRLDPDTQAGELEAGRWVPVTKNTWQHGEIIAKICVVLGRYTGEHPGWSISAGDPGTKLAHDPDVLRGPDVAIARAERKPTGRGAAGWLEGAPDVAIEVIGDAQSSTELMKKALEYLAAGARMVWILDPGPRRLLLITPPDHIRVLERDDTLDGADVLPGFSCKVGELFA